MKKKLRIIYSFVLLLVLGFEGIGQDISVLKNNKILVFSKTVGYRHESIPTGIEFFRDLGKKTGFAVDTTENSQKFTEANLKNYKVVVFMCTTQDVLNAQQQVAFERYIQAGGGFVGIHAASDTEYGWPWYGGLVGGWFNGHPGRNVSNVQKGTMVTLNKTHASTQHLPDTWEHTDEFYDFKNLNPSLIPLVRVDENSYKEGKMGDNHPMAWYHEYDGGRAFYTNFGHTKETFSFDLTVKHIIGGLAWAAAGPALNYSKARSQNAPDENRFTKVVLDQKLDEPTEMAIAKDGKVFFGERKGKLKLYNPKTKKTKTINDLDVYKKHEYGLMGVGLDPDFEKNNWVYLYYSSTPDTANFLSRFTFNTKLETLDLKSEKRILKVPVKFVDCCHTGGSIDWDKAGNLYLSTGDDTNPFNSDGYGPMDNRPGRSGWDARYTSSNTNDLRGKILRIKPTNDGSYTIPSGNLFAVGTDKTRPEIYVMGCRNPYRISVDRRTGYLYWGDVGPDAGEASEKYGPRGHDEHNQARKAGYFGWPLFVADNRAYKHRDFTDNNTSYTFDAKKPINDSPFNTGLTELPPANKAFIYYPYVDSPEFGPLVTKGGRNAMAGPVYYSDDYPNTSVKFPKYYDGKYFAYDWMRDWINPVTMHTNGDYASMEQFMPNSKFSHTIDLHFGPEGALYVLEYGQNWFAQNDEAMLSRIEYNAGNRAPKIVATASKKVGATPLTVSFNAASSTDPDGDAMRYEWNFGNGIKSTLPNPKHTYARAGNYKATVKVTDKWGKASTETINIVAGNDAPVVQMKVAGNQTFYWDNEKVEYEVNVTDKEDGSTTNKKIADEDIYVTMDFLEGYDKTILEQGHKANLGFSNGKRLIELSDCKACHAVDKKSIGPSYQEVAKKYNSSHVNMLVEKIIKGGGGVWGEQAMSAHPQVSKDDAKEMVNYILSLKDPKKASAPTKGSYTTAKKSKSGRYIFSASYTDKGHKNIGPQTGSETIALRPASFKAIEFDENKESMKYTADGIGEILVATVAGGYAVYKDLDFTNIESIAINGMSMEPNTVGGTLELRLGSASGTKIGSVDIVKGSPMKQRVSITATTGKHNLYLVFKNDNAGGKPLFIVSDLSFEKAK